MSVSEEVIRQRAYDLWDQAGRPNDRSDEFWFAATAEFEREERPEDGRRDARSAANACKELAASLKDAVGYYFAPTPAAVGGSKARRIESVAIGETAEDGSLLKLTGGDPLAPSNGATGGFSIRVPDAFEREASEHTVRVRVLARSAKAAPTRMAIAYSTAEVGNSGWQWRDVGANWAIFELVWRVPKMINGNGDYIGLLPDKPGAPGVEIHSVCASIF